MFYVGSKTSDSHYILFRKGDKLETRYHYYTDTNRAHSNRGDGNLTDEEQNAVRLAVKKYDYTQEEVKFVSGKSYLHATDEVFNNLFFCTKGKREIVVLCSEALKAELKALPSEYLTHTFIEIKAFLTKNNIPFIEDYSIKDCTKV